MPSALGTPYLHNECFLHNEPHNDAPSVSVRELWDVLWGRGSPASEGVRAGEPEVPAVNLVNTKLRFAPF